MSTNNNQPKCQPINDPNISTYYDDLLDLCRSPQLQKTSDADDETGFPVELGTLVYDASVEMIRYHDIVYTPYRPVNL
ncbi:11067_t:CDS:2 [Entrophospora sp. SA101]|nr:11067_t:CDS:2 [Entrophospora sp. SA101]